jgi:hypothetical protein
MVNAEYSRNSQKPTLVPVITESEVWIGSTRRARERTVATPFRRFNRVTIGFWLGAATSGTVGCIIGGCMPYHHLVVTAINMIWWGIYFGCLGGSLGALLGWFAQNLCSRTGTRTSEIPSCSENDSGRVRTDELTCLAE